MKVMGGLVGITQQPNALARFFLTAPELQRVSQETLSMCGSSSKLEARKHHKTMRPLLKLKIKQFQFYLTNWSVLDILF